MVKTKTEVKLLIGKYIDGQTKPFTTQELKEEIAPQAGNIHLAPNRLVKFIQSTGKAEFDKKKKEWSNRIRVK
jgi:hypothetical protein